MSHQAGGQPLAFQFHAHREPDARRQGALAREEHVIVQQAAQPRDLWSDSSRFGNQPGLPDRPAAAQAAFAAAAAGDGGPFNLPDVPGASGYATVYFSADLQRPLVLLAGFEISESHLVPISDEALDYGDPSITADDVVDRASLKGFVTAAGEYFIEFLESGNLASSSKARIALRDPNGPWRHGPVYIGIMERASKLILFHGGDPDRFELRYGGIARDIATGELVVDQLIAAAESGPEGGFWQYYFDNPADDTDSAEVPKVGYARVFAAHIPFPNGSTVPADFIINSGFYLTPDSVFAQRILRALEEGQLSIMFGITAPDVGGAVSGDAVTVSVEGAPTDTVRFAYRLAGLPDDDYELDALYTEDDGYTVIYDNIEVNVDNVGDGGCATLPVLPGGPVYPTLPTAVGLALAYLIFGRRRPVCQVAVG